MDEIKDGDAQLHPPYKNDMSFLKKQANNSSASNDGLVLLPVDKEIAAAPIENALYSTGKFTTEECSDLAEGILTFIDEHDLVVAKKN